MTSQAMIKSKLPDTPGVYIFRDRQKRPLYIGRATSLRDRTKSYFAVDLIETRGPRIVDMVTKAVSLAWQETDSVLEAIILESNLIKRYQPFYNVDERDDKSSEYVVITDELWPRVFLVRARDLEQRQKEQGQKTGTDAKKASVLGYRIRYQFGPYPHGGLIKEALKILRKLFPFKDKKAFDARHDAFYRAIGRSPLNDDTAARRRYLRTITGLALFFQGKKAALRKRLEKDMKAAIKELRFEDAGQAKRLLYAIDHINDIALIKSQELGERSRKQGEGRQFRMEAYDVAHLSGTDRVGGMAVSLNGQLARAEYRKFKISREGNDDAAALAEMLSRRLNHSEWAYPDMIIVDGNQTQMGAAETVLKARRINIPVVAVTKDDRHKAVRLLGQNSLINAYQGQIIALNAEAHRYVLAFHRLRRGKRLRN